MVVWEALLAAVVAAAVVVVAATTGVGPTVLLYRRGVGCEQLPEGRIRVLCRGGSM